MVGVFIYYVNVATEGLVDFFFLRESVSLPLRCIVQFNCGKYYI